MLKQANQTLQCSKQQVNAKLPSSSNVDFHGALSVDGETLVRIDGNTEETRVGVDEFIFVPDHRIPQNTSIIEIGQAGHIIRAVKFGRIDLSNLISLEDFFLEIKNSVCFLNI